MFRLLASDLRAKASWLYGDASTRSLIKVALTDGTAASVIYRVMQWARNNRLFLLEMGCNRLNTIFSGCIIGRGADFGPSLVLVHAIGVVINGSVKAGKSVVIEHQVTIGAEKGASPVLGDDIFVGAGAKIVGAVRIGNRVRIGANAVVLKDIPDDCTAVGVPARIIPHGTPAASLRD